MSRVSRSTWNYLTVVAYSATTLVIGLFATRLLVAWLGTERLGAFKVVSDWSGYLGLLEVGLGGALMPMIARAINRGEPGELASAMASGFHGYRRILIFNLLGGALMIALVPRVIPTSGHLNSDLRLAFAIVTIGALLLPFAPLRQLWEADQRGSMVTLILIVQSLVITGASVLFARLGWGVAGQSLAVLLGIVVYAAVLFVQTLRRHPDLLRWFLMPAPPQCRAQLWALNWPTLTMSISGRLSLLSDNIVIAHFLGASAVVPFFITQRLSQILVGQLQAIGNSTWAGMVQVYETQGAPLFNVRLLELTELIVILGLAGMVPIVAYNAAFIELWMPGAGLYGGLSLTLLAGANGIFLAVVSFWGWMFSGTGRIGKLVTLNIVSAIVNLAVSVGASAAIRVMYPRWSLIGPVLGTSIAFVTCHAWWMPLLLRRSFNTPISSLLASMTKPLIIAAPMGVLLCWLARIYPPHHWWLLALEMAAAGCAQLLLAWAFLLNPAQRTGWADRLARSITFLSRPVGPAPADVALPIPQSTGLTSVPLPESPVDHP